MPRAASRPLPRRSCQTLGSESSSLQADSVALPVEAELQSGGADPWSVPPHAGMVVACWSLFPLRAHTQRLTLAAMSERSGPSLSNTSIERSTQSPLRALWAAAHVAR